MSPAVVNSKASRSHQALIDACDHLKASATEGLTVGLAVVVLMKRRRFLVEAFGEAQRDPVFVRGALQSLDDLLSELAKEREDSDTTL